MEQESSLTGFPGENNEETDSNGSGREKTITTLTFFAFGFILYAIDSLIIAAAQDIIVGSDIPTSAALSCVVGPYTLITLVCPYFVQKIPYLVRIVVVFVLFRPRLHGSCGSQVTRCLFCLFCGQCWWDVKHSNDIVLPSSGCWCLFSRYWSSIHSGTTLLHSQVSLLLNKN